MVEILVHLLSPLCIPMGISSADLPGYLDGISDKLLIAGAIVIVFLGAMILAHFLKKGWRAFARCQAVLCLPLALVILLNVICYHPPVYAPLSAYLNADDAVSAPLDTVESEPAAEKSALDTAPACTVSNMGRLFLTINITTAIILLFGESIVTALFLHSRRKPD